jgi:hypothetical protein
VRKSSALCINLSPDLNHDLQQKGFSTPHALRHVRIGLGKTIEDTLRDIYRSSQTKNTSHDLPMGIHHRGTLINSAIIPPYNHILMALPLLNQTWRPFTRKYYPFFGHKQLTLKLFKKDVYWPQNSYQQALTKGAYKFNIPRIQQKAYDSI